MTNITGFTFLSTDGKTQLHGMRWEPEGRSVRAVLQICHGVAEHIARYDAFARYLNELGIAVVGHDHLGHGRSLPEGGTPVYFGAGSTWHTVVDDIYVLHQRIRLWYPDVPLCIMGHSMGSFLTRTYLIRYPGTVKAAIIMGTGWQPKAVVAGLFRQMLLGIRFNQRLSNLRRMDAQTPVLFIAGDKDPVGANGAGVRRTYQEFLRAGMQDCTLKLYPGLRHEILNEKGWQREVFRDIGLWLTAKL